MVGLKSVVEGHFSLEFFLNLNQNESSSMYVCISKSLSGGLGAHRTHLGSYFIYQPHIMQSTFLDCTVHIKNVGCRFSISLTSHVIKNLYFGIVRYLQGISY